MTEITNNPEVPRQKRKYTKRAKMLLRSNNDYIDHTYWPKAYAQSKKRHARIIEKYGVDVLNLEPHVFTEQEREDFQKMGIGKTVKIAEITDTPVVRIPIIENQ